MALAAIVVSNVREPFELPTGSPEAVVQRYLQAVADRDAASIRDTYTSERRRRCESEEGEHPVPFDEERRAFDADLLDTRAVHSDAVEVRVRITELGGEPPFGGGGYDHTEVFVVERVDGAWGIAEAAWPYEFCPVS